MNAFEIIVGQFLEDKDYWVRHSVKVNISKEDKRTLELPSMPRPEIDLVAYKAKDDDLLLVEAKSYLDSPGVRYESLVTGSSRYRLFTNGKFRKIVTQKLKADFFKRGLITNETHVKYALAAGKIYSHDEESIKKLFDRKGWIFYTPKMFKDHLEKLSRKGYEDDLATMTAKILKR